MSKHTPGPWDFCLYKSGAFEIEKNPNDLDRYMVLAARNSHTLRAEEMHANARLIAAAPENYACNVELAKIVRELCAAYNHPLPKASLDRSDAAIAKAEGV